MNTRRIGAIIGVLGLIGWGVWWSVSAAESKLVGAELLWFHPPWFGADFWSQPDYAARVFWGGVDVYTREDHLFHYPPIVIRLFSWTTMFSTTTALRIWLAFLVGLLAYATIVALKVRKGVVGSAPPAPLAILLVLLSYPVLFELERTNFNLLVLVAILAGLKLMERGTKLSDFLAGCAFAVAPWVKLFPGIMGLGLLAVRRVWAVAGFVVGGIVIGLLTPGETLRSFHIIDLAIQRNREVAIGFPFNVWSHSLSSVWLRLSREYEGTALGAVTAAIPDSVAPLFFIAPLALWVSFKVFRSKEPFRVAYPLLLFLCALASYGPVIANDYSLVFLPLAVTALYARGSGRLAHVAMLLSLPFWQPFKLPLPAYLFLGCKLAACVAVGAAIVRVAELDQQESVEASWKPLGVMRVLERVRAAVAARPAYFEIFVTAFAGLLLEIAYTRIFSFKIYYYFTYPLLGVGLLGVGAGGIALSTSERLRKIPLERLVPVTAFVGAASVLVGYGVIASIQLNIVERVLSIFEIGKLVFTMLVLLVTFFSVGLILSAILGAAPESAGRLYAADLAGAALAAALAIPLVAYLGPPRAVVLSGLALASAGLRFSRGTPRLFRSGVALIAILAVPVVFWGLLPDPVVARAKSFQQYKDDGQVWFSQWSPVFRVDIAAAPFGAGEKWLIFHDGQPGSGISHFDGTWERFGYFDTDSRALPFQVVPKQPKVLIIGAAGGQEILVSLYFDASHVTAIELNPVTVSLHTTVFADIGGRLAENPRVTLINGDGRWYLAHTRDQYDLIWLVAPDSYAAMNASTSASFVLSESYLYTREMVRESLRRLTPEGVICTQFGEVDYASKPNRTTRYLATAREAFEQDGGREFGEHVLVGTGQGFPVPESVIILGRQAFSKDLVQAFTEQALRTAGGIVRYTPGREPDESPVNRVMTAPGSELPAFFERSRYQVDPVRDDSPFFWHFTRFRDAVRAPPPPGGAMVDYEDSIPEQMTLLFLVLLGVLSGALLFAPLVFVRDAFREMPHKALSGIYFGALGLGFMFLEVASIQKLSLLLGYPTYSLTVTLFALLLSTGIASLLWSRLTVDRSRVVVMAFVALVAVVLAEYLLLPAIIEHFAGGALVVRVLVTALLVIPMGACLGAFLPAGLVTVSRLSGRSREYVAWAWAVNGFFSVIASVLATMLAMVLGFRNLLLLSLFVYAIGVVAFLQIVRQRAVQS